jgi:hypothetical protein
VHPAAFFLSIGIIAAMWCGDALLGGILLPNLGCRLVVPGMFR